MSMRLRKRSLTDCSWEPAGYFSLGGAFLYKSVAFEPSVSHGSIIGKESGILVVLEIAVADPEVGSAAGAAVGPRGEDGGETPGG